MKFNRFVLSGFQNYLLKLPYPFLKSLHYLILRMESVFPDILKKRRESAYVNSENFTSHSNISLLVNWLIYSKKWLLFDHRCTYNLKRWAEVSSVSILEGFDVLIQKEDIIHKSLNPHHNIDLIALNRLRQTTMM